MQLPLGMTIVSVLIPFHNMAIPADKPNHQKVTSERCIRACRGFFGGMNARMIRVERWAGWPAFDFMGEIGKRIKR